MAIFKKEEREKTKLELACDEVLKMKDTICDYRAKEQVIDYINRIILGETKNPFYEEELLIEVLKKYLDLNVEYNEMLSDFIIRVKDVFDQVYIDGKTKGYSNFDLFLSLFNYDGLIEKELFNLNFYRMFLDSTNFYTTMETITSLNLSKENFEKIINFLISIRSRYTSEINYNFALIDFLNKIVFEKDIDKLIKTTTEFLNKKDGIYDIDETTLDMLHEKVRGAEGFIQNLEGLTKRANKLSSSLKAKVDSYRSDLISVNNDSLKKYLQSIEEETNSLKNYVEEVKTEIDTYKILKRKEIDSETSTEIQVILSTLNEEKNRIVSSLMNLETSISSVALAKSTEISKLGQEQLSKLDTFVKDQPHLQELVNNMAPTKEVLNMISEASKQLAKIKMTSPNPDVQVTASSLFTAGSGAPTIYKSFENVDYTVNRFFDRKRSFTSRINELKEKMQRNIEEKGMLYHSETIKIVSALIEECPPYLYGPSGGGKSMLVALLSDLLELPYINTGYINEEYQVTGAEPFLGNFKPSSMHECYQLGKLAFIDEMDNGNAKANIVLNPFLRHSEDYYTFANGERVLRHPNFRVIAAGNTNGRGGTRNHGTREAIEGSVLQRLVPFYVGYDPNVEKAILKNYPEWYNFILAFRTAQATYGGNEGELTVIDAVTTSDATKIRNYLNDKVYTPEVILDLDFVQAKDYEYLEHIRTALQEYYSNNGTRKERQIYETFETAAKKYYKRMGFRN